MTRVRNPGRECRDTIPEQLEELGLAHAMRRLGTFDVISTCHSKYPPGVLILQFNTPAAVRVTLTTSSMMRG